MVDKRELKRFGLLITMGEAYAYIWEKRVDGARGRGWLGKEWEKHMQKLTRKKGKTLQGLTRVAKDRKACQIWPMQPDTRNGNKGLDKEE
jgi:hypothetical protein